MMFSFFGLAAYVTVESVRALLFGGKPEPSPVGIGLAIASLVIMPFLSWAQRRTGRALGSQAVVADSTQTLLCTYLSAVLLAGLVLNATVGWGWADPLAGLVIAGVAVKEGIDAWRGDGCCAPTRGGEDGHHRCATDVDGSCDDGCCAPPVPGSPAIQLSPQVPSDNGPDGAAWIQVVRERGVEPLRPKAPDPKSGVAAVTPLPLGPGV
jgi:hypothetical protein